MEVIRTYRVWFRDERVYYSEVANEHIQCREKLLLFEKQFVERKNTKAI